MAATEVLTLRITPTLLKKLNKLAKVTDRTRSRLALEALEKYVDSEAWQVEAIEKGLREADAGDVVPHDDVVKWMKQLEAKSKKRLK